MATPPTRVAFVAGSSYTTTTTPKTLAMSSLQVGDIVVVMALGSNAAGLATTAPTATGITFTQRVNMPAVANAGVARIIAWTGVVGTAGSPTISVPRPTGANAWNCFAWVFRNHGGVGNSTGADSTGSTTGVATSANSAIAVAAVDWNAIDGTTRTRRTVNGSTGTEEAYFRNTTDYAVYASTYADSGAAGTSTVGWSAPAGQATAIGMVEILGTTSSTTTVGKTSATSWNTRATVVDSTATSWAVRTTVTDTHTTSWNVFVKGTAGKFYLTGAAPGYRPGTVQGTWNDSSLATANTYALAGNGSGANTAVALAETSTTNPYKALLTRHVSEPLQGGVLTAVTNTLQLVQARLEDNAAANMTVQIAAWITVGDTDTVRGWVINPFAGATEFATTTTAFSFSLGMDASLTVHPKDRLVVEIGYSAANAAATSYTGTVRVGGTAGDLATSGTTGVTTNSPYIVMGGAGAAAVFSPYVPPVDGAFEDQLFRPFTSPTNALSSEYHVFASGITGPNIPLVIELHGDGAYSYLNPQSTYALAGSTGLVKAAKDHGFILVSALAPDTSGSVTWWEGGAANAIYLKDLIAKIKTDYAIDNTRVWFSTMSGGSQQLTEYFLPAWSSTIDGGGAVIFGGGDVPLVTVSPPFASGLKADFPMHFVVGEFDDGVTLPTSGFNGRQAADDGKAYYGGQGFSTTMEVVAGQNHDLPTLFGGYLDEWLDAEAAGTTTVGKTTATTWDTRVAVAKTNGTSWNATATVVDSSTTSWNVRQTVPDSTATTWAVRGGVTKTTATIWLVTAPVIDSTATSWAVRGAVTKTNVTAWNVRALIPKTSATRWNTLGTLTEYVFGVSLSDLGGLTQAQAVAAHEADIGGGAGVIHNYHWFSSAIPTADETTMTNQGRMVLYSWQTTNGPSTAPTWAEIAAGTWDTTIDAEAARIGAMSGPIMINFQNEPESSVGVYGTALEYAAAWRHIHDRFTLAGVTNVIWTFVVMGVTPVTTPRADLMLALYPGDAYVDVIMWDPYNWAAARGDDWKSFSAIVAGWYTWAAANLSSTKPYGLAEYGTVEDPNDSHRKEKWFHDAADVLRARIFPLLKYLIYFDWKGSGESVSTPDGWLLNSSTQARQAYRELVTGDYSTIVPLPTGIEEGYEAVGNGNAVTTANTASTSVVVGTGAALTGDTSVRAHGATSMHATTGATASTAYQVISIPPAAQSWMRTTFQFTAAPGAEARLIRFMNGANACAQIKLTTGRKITIGNSTNVLIGTSATTLAPNTWYRIEVMCLASATVGQVEVKIFTDINSNTPTETLTTTATQNTGTIITDIWHGIVVNASSLDWHFDDLAVSATGYPGAVVDGTTVVGTSTATSWAVRTTVTPVTTATSWAVQQRVLDSVTTSWKVAAVLPDSTATAWAVRQAVVDSAATSWNVSGTVGKTSATSWAVAGAVNKTNATTWAVRGAVSKTTTSGWSVLAGTAKISATSWAVRQQVLDSNTTTWNTIATVTKTSQTRWDTTATTVKTVAASWNVRTVVAAVTTATSWAVLGQVFDSTATAWSVFPRVQPNPPTTGLLMRLNADDITGADGSAVAAWPDSSGNSLPDAVQATSANQPTLLNGALNGHKAVVFDGTNDRLAMSGTALDVLRNRSAANIFIIYNSTGTTSTRTPFAMSNGLSNGSTRMSFSSRSSTGTLSAGGRRLDADAAVFLSGGAAVVGANEMADIRGVFSTNDLYLLKNGTLVTSSLTWQGTGNLQDTRSLGGVIGANSAQTAEFFQGRIYEILIYDNDSDMLRAQVQQYVTDHYGIMTAGSADNAGLTTIGKTADTTWAVTEQVSDTTQTSWNVIGRVATTTATTWDTWARVTDSTATSWNVIGKAVKTASAGWDVEATVTDSAATSWAARQQVPDTAATSWAVRQTTTDSTSTSWNVTGVPGIAGKVTATSWDDRVQITKTSGTSWSTRGAAAKTSATSWTVRQQVQDSTQTSWVVRAQVTDTTQTRWDVWARITDTASTSWNTEATSSWVITTTALTSWAVLATTNKTSATKWDVVARVIDVVSATWSVIGSAGTQTATSWNMAQQVGKTSGGTWSVSLGAADSVSTSWAVAKQVQATTDTRWNILSNAILGMQHVRIGGPRARGARIGASRVKTARVGPSTIHVRIGGPQGSAD